MPVTAYADQKCYGDIIVFQRFDDQAIYPYFAPVSSDKTKKSEVRNKTIIIQKRKQKQDEFLTQKKNEEVHTKKVEEKKNSNKHCILFIYRS
ncbi:sporulation and cell division repeat domain protein [Acinetobacter sp. 72431]|nr:sporulation and cell division repeat domain protein [Acinetobacter sp. 72431]